MRPQSDLYVNLGIAQAFGLGLLTSAVVIGLCFSIMVLVVDPPAPVCECRVLPDGVPEVGWVEGVRP